MPCAAYELPVAWESGVKAFNENRSSMSEGRWETQALGCVCGVVGMLDGGELYMAHLLETVVSIVRDGLGILVVSVGL